MVAFPVDDLQCAARQRRDRLINPAEQVTQPQSCPTLGQRMTFLDVGGITVLLTKQPEVMAAQRIHAVFREIAAAGQRC